MYLLWSFPLPAMHPVRTCCRGSVKMSSGPLGCHLGCHLCWYLSSAAWWRCHSVTTTRRACPPQIRTLVPITSDPRRLLGNVAFKASSARELGAHARLAASSLHPG